MLAGADQIIRSALSMGSPAAGLLELALGRGVSGADQAGQLSDSEAVRPTVATAMVMTKSEVPWLGPR
jgi:hypothetical protein